MYICSTQSPWHGKNVHTSICLHACLSEPFFFFNSLKAPVHFLIFILLFLLFFRNRFLQGMYMPFLFFGSDMHMHAHPNSNTNVLNIGADRMRYMFSTFLEQKHHLTAKLNSCQKGPKLRTTQLFRPCTILQQ